MSRQVLTLKLDEITASDYLTWVRDPDPPAPGLRSIGIRAEPLGDTIEVALSWEGSAPSPPAAASAAGFPATPEVISVDARKPTLTARRPPRRQLRRRARSALDGAAVAAAC